MPKKKIDWWKIAGYWYSFIAGVNILLAIYFILVPAITTGSLGNLTKDSIGAGIGLFALMETGVYALIPYLYFKKNKIAMTLSIIVFVILEGGMKFLALYYPDNRNMVLRLGAIAFSVLPTLFLVYKIKTNLAVKEKRKS